MKNKHRQQELFQSLSRKPKPLKTKHGNGVSKKVDYTNPGSMLMFKNTTNDWQDVGMVLVYVPDFEGNEYVVSGTYSRDELNRVISTPDSDDTPKVTIVVSKVVKGELQIMYTKNDPESERIVKAIYEIARNTPEINELVSKLLKVSLMNAITSGMADTYKRNSAEGAVDENPIPEIDESSAESEPDAVIEPVVEE